MVMLGRRRQIMTFICVLGLLRYTADLLGQFLNIRSRGIYIYICTAKWEVTPWERAAFEQRWTCKQLYIRTREKISEDCYNNAVFGRSAYNIAMRCHVMHFLSCQDHQCRNQYCSWQHVPNHRWEGGDGIAATRVASMQCVVVSQSVLVGCVTIGWTARARATV